MSGRTDGSSGSVATSGSARPRPGGFGDPLRMVVVWCPDWPVVAAIAQAGAPAQVPAAVLAANRVVVCSATARANGVHRGMRRRQAQGCCPELAVFDDDPTRDAQLFEPVALAVEELAVGVEIVRPGVLAFPARGPVNYFGGQQRLAERLIDQLAASTGVECQVGIADGLFTALLAAHRSVLVEPGQSASFLAPLNVAELDQPGMGPGRAELVDLLHRLGLRTLGAFGAVPERDVAARFGTAGIHAHRLARGLEERPPNKRRPPPELSVTEALDPPVDRVDAAAFVAKGLAERLHAELSGRGLACTRLGINATTERGEQLGRVWRCAEPLSPAGIADRVRWQLDGWLRAGQGARPTAGICLLRIEPVETVDGQELQLGLWDRPSKYDTAEHRMAAERASRALVRVQGLLGSEGVLTPVLQGGRGPAERVRLVPWGDERVPDADPDPPWPGRLPAPSPATVSARPPPAVVLDESGAEVEVTARGELTGVPHAVRVGDEPVRAVCDWAGPWLVDQRWWEPRQASQRTRVQVVLRETREVAETALLLLREEGRNPKWTVEGVYD